ncbi:hypothetical protein WJX79_004564 [Trebouxia sp. C0005]
MESHRLSQLRKKLHALQYKEGLDDSSAPLVDKLVTDLLHTTDSHRDLKLQVATKAQELEDGRNKVEGLTRDAGRLGNENNQLHLQLLKAADVADKADRDHYQQVKKLEGQLTELACWKHQTAGRFHSLEQENAGLRVKVEDILRLGEKHPRPDARLIEASSRIAISHIIEPKPASTASAALPNVNLLKTADDRVATLETDLKQKQQELTQVHEQLDTLQAVVKRRDDEIQRLAARAEKGPDANQMNLRYKNETNESIILQLNSQVDFMTSQMSEMQREVDDKLKIEAALKKAEQARKEADMKLRGAVAENDSITQEIAGMKVTLMKLQTERVKAGGRAAHEVDAALAKVIDLKGELANSKAGQAAIKQAVGTAAKEHAASMAREKSLKDDVRQLQSLLDRARSQHDSLQRQVIDQTNELDSLRGSLTSSRQQLAASEQELDRVKAELRIQSASFQDMQAERELAQIELAELRKKLEELHSTASADHLAKVDLESRQHRLHGDSSRLEKRLSVVEADRESLSHQLKDAVQAKGRASAALQQAQQQQVQSSEHLALLSKQLAEERLQEAALSANVDNLLAELARYKTQVEVLHSEKEVLEEAAANANARMQEDREALAAQTKQLGQLQYLPPRLQDMQEQVREYMDRMVKADSDASKAQADANKAQKALRQLETDVDALRRSLDQAEVDKSKVSEKLLDAQHEVLHLKSSLEAWESKAKHASNDKETALKQVSELQERLDAQGSSAQQSSQAIRAIEQRTAALQRQMRVKDEDLEALRQQLAESQQTAEALRGSGMEARAQAQEYGERARRAETLNQEHSADLASLRSEQERLKHRARQAEDHVIGLRRQLDDRSREVEQLTTLSLKGDATLQEYMAQLTRVSSEAKAADLHSSDLQAELRHQQEILEERDAEIRRLQKTVEAIDSERDILQADLDGKAEMVANLTEELELGHQQADDANRALAVAEGELQRAGEQIAEYQNVNRDLVAQADDSKQYLQACEGECNALRDECRAISEDLEVLVKENQVVNHQLTTAVTERDDWHADLRSTRSKLAQAEQLARAKESEVEDLRKAYESLAGEKRRLQSGVAQLERELVAREGQLSGQAGELAALQEAQRDAHAQMNQYVMDLQAGERQADVLSRQVSKSSTESQDLAREREVLLDKLRAAEQVRFQLEQTREGLQRQLAAADGQMHILQARLEDSQAEQQAVQHKLALEANRVGELEGLLSGMRTNQFKSNFSEQHTADRAGSLQARNTLLTQQVASLQTQVTGLQQTAFTQQAQLEKVNQEALAFGNASAQEQAALRQDTQATAGNLQSLEQQRLHLQGQRASLESQLSQSQRTATDLQLQVSSLETERQQLEQALQGAHAEIQTLRGSAGSRPGTSLLEMPTASTRELQEALQRVTVELEEANRELHDLREENQHAMDLIAKLDLEKAQLQRAQDSGSKTIPAKSLSPGKSLYKVFGQDSDSTIVAELQSQLEQEKANRQQAERDFNDLVESVEAMQLGTGINDGGQISS